MDKKYFSIEPRDQKWILTINRPEVMNAISPPTTVEMDRAFNEFDEDPDPWVCIITGAGDRAFSAGNDLKYQAQHGAEAIAKGMELGDHRLAEQVYCGVPSSMVGRQHTIEIGPLSGSHNVRFWLKSRDIKVPDVVVDKILEAAKEAHRLLTDDEILRIVTTMQRRLGLVGGSAKRTATADRK